MRRVCLASIERHLSVLPVMKHTLMRIDTLLILSFACTIVGCSSVRLVPHEPVTDRVRRRAFGNGDAQLFKASFGIYEIFVNRQHAVTSSVLNVMERGLARTPEDLEVIARYRSQLKNTIETEQQMIDQMKADFDPAADTLYYYKVNRRGKLEEGWLAWNGTSVKKKWIVGTGELRPEK